MAIDIRKFGVDKDLRADKSEKGILVDKAFISAVIRKMINGGPVQDRIMKACENYAGDAHNTKLEFFSEIKDIIAIDMFAEQYTKQIQSDLERSANEL